MSLPVKPEPKKAASRIAASPAAEVTMRVALLAMIARTRTAIAARTKTRPSAACRASSAPLPNQEACPGWPAAGALAALAAAAFGVLAAVRALRGAEDAGRTEIVLAGIVTRRTVYLSAMAALGAATLILGAAEFAGLAAGGLPVRGSAYLALATVTVIPVFAGIGAVASQLAPSRRLAAELSGAAAGLFFLLRVIADTVAGAGWLR